MSTLNKDLIFEYCWIDNYYKPILERSEAFLEKYNYSAELKEFVEAGKIEALITLCSKSVINYSSPYKLKENKYGMNHFKQTDKSKFYERK